MKREFKFEVGQYVKIAEEILRANKDLPKYPCKIAYRFFDGKEISYLTCDDNGNKRPFIERDLVPYANDSNDYGTIPKMKKEIHDMKIRIKDLEIKVQRKDKDSNELSASESNIGFNARIYDEKEQYKLYLPNDEEAVPAF
jgi:hypothetical protein|nr:MAG TPA: YorP protein [Caudoviricetes sp.]